MNDLTPIALLKLMRLVSPLLPVGAYAYSQGLEHAVERGLVSDESTAAAWITGVMGQTVSTLDIPLLVRLQQAWQVNDMTAIDYWSAFLSACRETAELRAEDRQLGLALSRLLAELGLQEAVALREHPHMNWPLPFALACARWHIDAYHCALGYLWSWCENQVAAAIKLVPLGQTAGQRILGRCIELMPELVQTHLELPEADIGQLAQGLAIASAQHETQYSRLFRS